MNLIKLTIANLRYNLIGNIFNVIVLALGVAIITTLLNISGQIEKRFESDLAGIDLVVGAKGSPVQLILSSIFQIDAPTGNIPLEEAEKLEKNHLVASAIPLALGDSYKSFRIVGSSSDYPKHYGAELSKGAYWTKEMQAVIGSEVARVTGLTIGQKFTGSHGLSEGGEEHKEFPYEVTGILAPTGSVIDRLIITDVASVWNIHEHHHHDALDDDDDDLDEPHGREITSLLITYKTPLAAASLPRLINSSSSMQSASPAAEMARLSKIIGIGGDTINLFGFALIFIAAIGFFVTLFNAVNERSYDIALLRTLGATRKKIFSFVLAEGLSLGVIGALLGALLGSVFSNLTSSWIATSKHISLQSSEFGWENITLLLITIIISGAVSLIPAFMAYRVNVAKVISSGN